MSDAICRQCGEPWDVYGLRHDEPHEGPSVGMPEDVADAVIRFVRAVDTGREPKTVDRDAVYTAVLSGRGCPACWDDPSRILTGEAADRVHSESLFALFDCTDDDPAAFL